MSRIYKYIVQDSNMKPTRFICNPTVGSMLTFKPKWSTEYPDATYWNKRDARRIVKRLRDFSYLATMQEVSA